MHGQYHPIPYSRGKGEKLIANLTVREVLWWGIGLYLSNKASEVLPLLPLDSFIFARVHYLVPLGICMIFCYVKHGRSGMTMFGYVTSYMAFNLKQRKFRYKKGGA